MKARLRKENPYIWIAIYISTCLLNIFLYPAMFFLLQIAILFERFFLIFSFKKSVLTRFFDKLMSVFISRFYSLRNFFILLFASDCKLEYLKFLCMRGLVCAGVCFLLSAPAWLFSAGFGVSFLTYNPQEFLLLLMIVYIYANCLGPALVLDMLFGQFVIFLALAVVAISLLLLNFFQSSMCRIFFDAEYSLNTLEDNKVFVFLFCSIIALIIFVSLVLPELFSQLLPLNLALAIVLFSAFTFDVDQLKTPSEFNAAYLFDFYPLLLAVITLLIISNYVAIWQFGVVLADLVVFQEIVAAALVVFLVVTRWAFCHSRIVIDEEQSSFQSSDLSVDFVFSIFKPVDMKPENYYQLEEGIDSCNILLAS